MKTASWIVVSRETGRAVLETYSASVAAKVNTVAYEVLPVLEWLHLLNRELWRAAA
jgi:hypothetical protein